MIAKYLLMSFLMLINLSAIGQSPESHYESGMVKLQLGDFQGAITYYSKAIELDRTFVNAYVRLSEAHVALGDYRSAVRDVTSVIELEPANFKAYYNRGCFKTELEDSFGAVHDFGKVIEINPSYLPGYYNRGLALTRLKQYGNAIKDFSIVIELDGRNPMGYYGRGVARVLSGGIYSLESGCLDLSKAGELGDDKAYEVIKQYCK